MDHRTALVHHSLTVLDEIKDRTPGSEVEEWLNRAYGPGSATYWNLAAAITRGVEDGWAAEDEVTGPHYRRGMILEPTALTHYFSLHAMYVNSHEPMLGQRHLHPYGEISLVVPISPGAKLAGPLGWRGCGWIVQGPGSRHAAEVKGGALIALVYLPAGRVAYDI